MRMLSILEQNLEKGAGRDENSGGMAIIVEPLRVSCPVRPWDEVEIKLMAWWDNDLSGSVKRNRLSLPFWASITNVVGLNFLFF